MNPFRDDICRNPETRVASVGRLNAHVVEAIRSWVETVDLRGNGTKFLPVISSEPGWGKTHSLSRAVELLAPDHLVVPLVLAQNDITLSIMGKLPGCITRSPVNRQPRFGFEALLLDLLNESAQFPDLRGWLPHFIAESSNFQDWLLQSNERIVDAIGGAIDSLGLLSDWSEEEAREWAAALVKLVSTSASRRIDGQRWMKGELLRVGDPLAVDEHIPDVEGEFRTERQARFERILQTLRLFSWKRPVLLLLDQTENALENAESRSAFFDFLERCVTVCPRVAVVVTANGNALQVAFENSNMRSLPDRMEQEVRLSPVDRKLGDELIALRFQEGEIDWEEGIRRLGETWLTQLFAGGVEIGARRFIRQCRDRWSDPSGGTSLATTTIGPIDWDIEFENRLIQLSSSQLVFDADDYVFTFIEDICGATLLTDSRYRAYSQEGYLLIVEAGQVWNRWENIAKLVEERGQPAIVFRPGESTAPEDGPRWASVPRDTWNHVPTLRRLVASGQILIQEIDLATLRLIAAASRLVLDFAELNAERAVAITRASEILHKRLQAPLIPSDFIAVASVAYLQKVARSRYLRLSLDQTLSAPNAGLIFHELVSRLCHSIRAGAAPEVALQELLERDSVWTASRDRFPIGRESMERVFHSFTSDLERRLRESGVSAPEFFIAIEKQVADSLVENQRVSLITTGRVDLIERGANGTPIIVDHKLSRNLDGDWHLMQLALYARMLASAPYNLRCDARVDIYLPDGTRHESYYDHARLSEFYNQTFLPALGDTRIPGLAQASINSPVGIREVSIPAAPGLEFDADVNKPKNEGEVTQAGSVGAPDPFHLQAFERLKQSHPTVCTAFSDFIGNEAAVLEVIHAIAGRRPEAPHPNFLLSGPGGLGKSHFARCIGKALDLPILETVGSVIQSASILLQKLQEFCQANALDIPTEKGRLVLPPILIFLDEAHLMSRRAADQMLKATEPRDRMLEAPQGIMDVSQGWFVFASTDTASLPGPLRTRFVEILMRNYTRADIAKILRGHPDGKCADERFLLEIAQLSQCNPRKSKLFLERIADYARSHSLGEPDLKTLLEFRQMHHLDPDGLGPEHYEFLAYVEQRPRSIGDLVAKFALNEDEITSLREAPLLSLDLIERTNRGRTITEAGRILLRQRPS